MPKCRYCKTDSQISAMIGASVYTPNAVMPQGRIEKFKGFARSPSACLPRSTVIAAAKALVPPR